MTAAAKLQGLNHTGFTIISGANNHIVDASNEGVSFAFLSETSGAITKVGFRYGARTGTPPVYRASLQSLNTSGTPDGTVLGGGSPASVTFTPPADTTWDGLFQWVTLDNSYTPTLGQSLAIVIEYSSGTIDGSNNSSFTRSILGMDSSPANPYSLTNTGGTWAKQTTGAVFGYATASTRHGRIVSSAYSTTVNTSGHRSTAAITIPSYLGTSVAILGINFFGRVGSAAATAKICVWDAAGTELAATITLDCDHQANVSSNTNWRAIFTTPPTLTPGTKYYFGVESISNSTVGVSGATLSEADDRMAYPIGASRALATWNGSAWTETDTVMPFVDLIFDDITPASGGGTLIICGE